MKRLKVAIATVGCRSNQADSARLVRLLDNQAVQVTSKFDEADVVAINTCCVTAEAERDCRKLTRRALGASNSARVVLFGCALSAIPNFGKGISKRVELRGGGDTDPNELAAWINELAGVTCEPIAERGLQDTLLGRTRALLKIQTGCSHFCAYCVVPRARGPEKSMPRGAILDEVLRLAKMGVREVVITGVQLGAWGIDLPGKPQLADLITEVADGLSPGRLRLSSIEPWSVDDALIVAISNHDRICPHLHVPLQSGDDHILNAMGRGYSPREYKEIIGKVRESIPDAAIGTDVLLGFPGEDDEAFNNTMQILGDIEPAYVHAFPFSPRPGTLAEELPGRPLRKVAKERVRVVREFQHGPTHRYRASQLGQIREVVVEEIRSSEVKALTDTFVPVVLSTDKLRPGDLVRARLESIDGKGRFRATEIM